MRDDLTPPTQPERVVIEMSSQTEQVRIDSVGSMFDFSRK